MGLECLIVMRSQLLHLSIDTYEYILDMTVRVLQIIIMFKQPNSEEDNYVFHNQNEPTCCCPDPILPTSTCNEESLNFQSTGSLNAQHIQPILERFISFHLSDGASRTIVIVMYTSSS